MGRSAAALGVSIVLACGDAEPGESDASTSAGASVGTSSAGVDASTATDDLPPMGAANLLPWLERGEYLDWAAERALHDSAGPHFGTVRTFVNVSLHDSLASASTPHPVDAAAVKELYGDGGEVVGWSVMIKIAEGEGGETWYWLEHFGSSTYADGVGDSLCTGCHGAGLDHVLSPFPLQ